MTTLSRQFIKLFARILITTGLLVWVFRQIDIEEFQRTVKTARWEFLVAVWGMTVFFFWIRSVKMQLILKKQDFEASVAKIFRASTVTCLYSMILPGLLSTGAKWYILKKDSGKGSNVLSSMVYNQLMTMFIMITFGLAALMITNPIRLLTTDVNNRLLLPLICGILLIVLILISSLLLNTRTGSKINKGIGVLFKPFPLKIRQKGQEILDQIAVFQTTGAGFHLKIALITTIDTIIGGVIIYILSARAANVTAPVGVLVWICVAIFVLGRIPISLANLGVRESMLVSLLSMYGVDKPSALLMSMILFSALVFMAGIGAILQLCWASMTFKSTRRMELGKSKEIPMQDLSHKL